MNVDVKRSDRVLYIGSKELRNYNDIENIGNVDWDMVFEKFWSPSETDRDRQRRKQAEFLIREHVPVECIEKIVVYNKGRYEFVQKAVDIFSRDIEVLIDNNCHFYYR